MNLSQRRTQLVEVLVQLRAQAAALARQESNLLAELAEVTSAINIEQVQSLRSTLAEKSSGAPLEEQQGKAVCD